jgi:hypothetical protein
MRDVPQDYSAIVFADQGLAVDFSRNPTPTPEPRAADLRRLQVEHVMTRMRAANGRPATFLWPEAA